MLDACYRKSIPCDIESIDIDMGTFLGFLEEEEEVTSHLSNEVHTVG